MILSYFVLVVLAIAAFAGNYTKLVGRHAWALHVLFLELAETGIILAVASYSGWHNGIITLSFVLAMTFLTKPFAIYVQKRGRKSLHLIFRRPGGGSQARGL